MTEDGGAAPRSPADLAGQLRDMADRLMTGWTTAAGAAGSAGAAGPSTRPPSLPGLPSPPATMSARQVEAVLDDLAARRAQVQSLRTQLEAFDEQLGSLEDTLRPVLEWTRTWADLEKSMTDFWRLPGAGPGGS